MGGSRRFPGQSHRYIFRLGGQPMVALFLIPFWPKCRWIELPTIIVMRYLPEPKRLRLWRWRAVSSAGVLWAIAAMPISHKAQLARFGESTSLLRTGVRVLVRWSLAGQRRSCSPPENPKSYCGSLKQILHPGDSTKHVVSQQMVPQSNSPSEDLLSPQFGI